MKLRKGVTEQAGSSSMSMGTSMLHPKSMWATHGCRDFDIRLGCWDGYVMLAQQGHPTKGAAVEMAAVGGSVGLEEHLGVGILKNTGCMGREA
ncbi:hypothetical protein GOP47_0008825 [Adiantum capillus-veneris]|uniref:Uncharacterized protein n=1 Tax=Adiantum capillus-veneris TaxID=13818 RepID=A0A9D4UZP9_ADICA|nr:hypothetical protein GOP47_0008825 [Adiantum capillus-veneris]